MAVREEWIASLASNVWRTSLAFDDQVAAEGLLAASVSDPISRALIVVEVARLDSFARPLGSISAEILERGLVSRDPLERLVRPCVTRFRNQGAPWDRFWDIAGLHTLLLELWVAGRLKHLPKTDVEGELSSLFRLGAPLVGKLMDVEAGPVLIPSLLAPGRSALYGFSKTAQGRDVVDRESRAVVPERLIDRPDLYEVARDISIARKLGELGGNQVREDIESWRVTLREALTSFSMWEVGLLSQPSRSARYQDAALTAGIGIHHVPMLYEDSHPTSADAGRVAPAWMQDQIVRGGARMWHSRIAPYALWLATAESREQLSHFKSVLSGDSVAVTFRLDGEVARFDLLVDRDSPDGPLAIPFSYDLSGAAEIWQLLHLAGCRRVRLTLLRLLEDEELTVVGAIPLTLDETLPNELQAIALQRLRDLVGEDAAEMRRAAIGLAEEDAIASATFLRVDLSRAEDLVLDAEALRPDRGAAWGAYVKARASLALARATLVELTLDGANAVAATQSVSDASAECSRLLDSARGVTSLRAQDSTDRLASIAAALPDQRTAFVHLYEKDGCLGAVWLTLDDSGPCTGLIDLSTVSLERIRAKTTMWSGSSERDLAAQGLSRVGLLDALLEDLGELMKPIVDVGQRLDLRRLILSPTHPLDVLPLHAAVAERQTGLTVGDMFEEVVYAPSLRLLSAVSAPTPSRGGLGPLLVAHSGSGHPSSVTLAGPAVEVGVLGELYHKAEVLEGKQATPQAVLAAMGDREIVHIASHGFTSDSRWATGLLLEGPTIGTGALTAAHVLSSPSQMSAQLVVLSACRTGTHENESTTIETMRGLDGAFIGAGATAVVSTLWEVGDVTALVFAALLHSGLRDGVGLGRAYRSAIAYLREATWTSTAPKSKSVSHAETLLDRASPSWRIRLQAEQPQSVAGWGPFKLSGVTW